MRIKTEHKLPPASLNCMKCIALLPSQTYSFEELMRYFSIEQEKMNTFFDLVHDASQSTLVKINDDGVFISEKNQRYILQHYKPDSQDCALLIQFLQSNLITHEKQEPETRAELLRISLSVVQKITGQSFTIANLWNQIAIYHHNKDEIEKAVKYTDKAINMLLHIHRKHPDLAYFYKRMALLQQANGKHTKAIEYSRKDLSIVRKMRRKNYLSIANTYDIMSESYDMMKNHTLALKYGHKALDLAEQIIPNSRSVGFGYQNLAITYYNSFDYENAIHYMDIAIQILQENEKQDSKSLKRALRRKKFYQKIHKFSSFVNEYHKLSVFVFFSTLASILFLFFLGIKKLYFLIF